MRPITPIQKALKAEDFEKAKQLIDASPDATIDEERTRLGNSLVWYAIQEENMNILRWLLANGANPSHTSGRQGYSCLETAFNYRNYEAMRILLDNGADLTYPRSARLICIASNRRDYRAIRLLLEYGADIDTVSSIGCTAFQEAYLRKERETMRFLIENEAHVDVTKTPLDDEMLKLCKKRMKRKIEPLMLVLSAAAPEFAILEIMENIARFMDNSKGIDRFA